MSRKVECFYLYFLKKCIAARRNFCYNINIKFKENKHV